MAQKKGKSSGIKGFDMYFKKKNGVKGAED